MKTYFGIADNFSDNLSSYWLHHLWGRDPVSKMEPAPNTTYCRHRVLRPLIKASFLLLLSNTIDNAKISFKEAGAGEESEYHTPYEIRLMILVLAFYYSLGYMLESSRLNGSYHQIPPEYSRYAHTAEYKEYLDWLQHTLFGNAALSIEGCCNVFEFLAYSAINMVDSVAPQLGIT